MKYLYALIIFFHSTILLGQIDSMVLSFSDYLKIIATYHPSAIEADLIIEEAEGSLLSAQGAFDVKLGSQWNNKSFDDKNYFTEWSTVLKIPTWIGADVKLNYDRNSGEFINNSNFLPTDGLFSAGISIPLWANRAWDERRAIVEEGKINRLLATEERIGVINELYLKAIQAYLLWIFDFQYLQIAQTGVTLARQQLDITRNSFEQGDKPAIDTLESAITLQKRELSYINAAQNLVISRGALQNYLWGPDLVPVELTSAAKPQELDMQWLAESMLKLGSASEEWISDQYVIRMLQLEQEVIQNDLRLSVESIKPDVQMEYNLLTAGNRNGILDSPRLGDYKIGISAAIPLQTRKGRGKINSLKAKSEMINIKVAKERNHLINQVRALSENLENQSTLINNYKLILQNQLDLLNAERTKFKIGESSVFLVISRQNKYLENQVNLIKVSVELIKMRSYLLYYTGKLWQIEI